MAKGQVGGGLLALGAVLKFLYDNVVLALILLGATLLIPVINIFMWFASNKILVGSLMDVVIIAAFAGVGFFVFKRFSEKVRRTAELVGIGVLGFLYLCTPWMGAFTKDSLILWWFTWIVSGGVVCIIDWYNDQYLTQEASKPAVGHSLAAFGLGAQEGQPKRFKTYVTNTLSLLPGSTVAEVKRNAEKIANQLGVNEGCLQIIRGELPSTVDMKITYEEPWQTPVLWEGPDQVGANIALPIKFGTYADGSDAEVYIAGKNGRSCHSFMVAGTTGSGKSTTLKVILASILARKEVSLFVADPLKGRATAGMFMEGIEWFADGILELERMRDALNNTVRTRSDYLTNKGYTHWVPGCGLNLIVFLIEEFSGAEGGTDNSKAWSKFINTVRAAGIVVIPIMQRADAKVIAGSIKSSLPGSFVHGLQGPLETRIAMGEHSTATPHEWKSKFPGRHYFESAYSSPDGDVVQSYTFDPSPPTMPNVADWQIEQYETIKEMLAYRHEYATPLDEVTRAALGKYYEDYRAARDGQVLEITTEVEIVEDTHMPNFFHKKGTRPADRQHEILEHVCRGKSALARVDIESLYKAAGGTYTSWATLKKWIDREVNFKRCTVEGVSGERGSVTHYYTFPVN